MGYSGGFDSLVTTHWAMNNVKAACFSTLPIGTDRHRERHKEWLASLPEINEEGLQPDYDKNGRGVQVPGAGAPLQDVSGLKNGKRLRDNKTKRSDNVMLLTGIRNG